MRAGFPVATTAIVVRRVGCRPIGASTVSPSREVARAPARDIRGSPFVPAARAPGAVCAARVFATTRGRSCPCPADGRCRRAARARAAARDAATHSAGVPSQLPAPGWTTSPAGLSTTSNAHRPRRRWKRRSLRGRSGVSCGSDSGSTTTRSPPRTRASAQPDVRPASRVRRRSTLGAGRAKIAATRARSARRSAGRPASAGSVSAWVAPADGGPGATPCGGQEEWGAGRQSRGVGYNLTSLQQRS